MKFYNIPPTEKQIKLAEDICKILYIDFPQNSSQFNKYTYCEFISAYIDKFKEAYNDANYYNYCDNEMAWFNPKENW